MRHRPNEGSKQMQAIGPVRQKLRRIVVLRDEDEEE